MKTTPNNAVDRQEKIFELLEKQLDFSGKKLGAYPKDFQTTTGKRPKSKLVKNPFHLLKFWMTLYMVYQKRLSDLEHLNKDYYRKQVEAKNHFLDMITLIDTRTFQPIDSSDQTIKSILSPEFEEQTPHSYDPLKEGSVSLATLTPPTKNLRGKTAKRIGELVNIINTLAFTHFSRILKEMLTFRVFRETLPIPEQTTERPQPKRQNVLSAMSLFWVIVLFLAYVASVGSEYIVFLNLGTTVLGLEQWKALIFSFVVISISYLLGLYFFDPIQKFLRSKGFVPKVYTLFLIAVLVYILSAGYLNYSAYDRRINEQKYLTEIQVLGTLQNQAFTDPNNTSLQSDIAQQQTVVNELGTKTTEQSPTAKVITGILYVLMGFLSLLVSGLLLAIKLTVSKVRRLKSQVYTSTKALVSIAAEYEHKVSVSKKLRELMSIYAFELGKFQAIESLLITPPTVAELDGKTPNNTPPKTGQNNASKQAKKPSESNLKETQDILDNQEYDALYQQ